MKDFFLRIAKAIRARLAVATADSLFDSVDRLQQQLEDAAWHLGESIQANYEAIEGAYKRYRDFEEEKNLENARLRRRRIRAQKLADNLRELTQ